MRVLLKVFAWSLAVAVVVLGIAVPVGVGWLTKEAAAYLMLGCLGVGGVVIGRRFSRPLLQKPPRKDEFTEPSAAPDDQQSEGGKEIRRV
jgi:hypothetical protein